MTEKGLFFQDVKMVFGKILNNGIHKFPKKIGGIRKIVNGLIMLMFSKCSYKCKTTFFTGK